MFVWFIDSLVCLYACVRMCFQLHIYIPIHPDVHLSICLSIYPSVYLSVCISMNLPIYKPSRSKQGPSKKAAFHDSAYSHCTFQSYCDKSVALLGHQDVK